MPSCNERRISWREAAAIIDNIEAKFSGTIPHLHFNIPGASVLERIRHRFLPDTEEIHLDFRRQTVGFSLYPYLDFSLVQCGHRLNRLGQGGNQGAVLQQLASQIPYRTACFNHAMPAHVARHVNRSSCERGALLETICG